ncbi:MAG: alpha/beta-hydrolase family protein [Sphingomonadales bacterium]|nr:alpha/beta-hydrolase family protein [Sphingomonadales bacterium]
MEPLRVYVGVNSAEGPERAALALAELLRIGAFERTLLVIATPTGTGWIDPAAMAPIEMLQRGDVASVSVQYSYLPSWLSLFTQPESGLTTSRAVFDAVYGYWRAIPVEKRPKLILLALALAR